jgi:hypothetical protein
MCHTLSDTRRQGFPAALATREAAREAHAALTAEDLKTAARVLQVFSEAWNQLDKRPR